MIYVERSPFRSDSSSVYCSEVYLDESFYMHA
jgi:hypothetical protein